MQAFKTDLDVPKFSEGEMLDLEDIRQSVRELSPFDEGGLCTFDELQSIDALDQYYLFFRHMLFLKDRGLLSKR